MTAYSRFSSHGGTCRRNPAPVLGLAVLAMGLAAAGPARALEEQHFMLGQTQFVDIDTAPKMRILGTSHIDPQHEASGGDARVEFRFSDPLSSDAGVTLPVKPWIGTEKAADGNLVGLSGILIDVPLGPIVFTPSIGTGMLLPGSGPTAVNGSTVSLLSSRRSSAPVEVRTQFEVGYELENKSRFSLGYSHVTNGSLGETGGTSNNVFGFYYHLPSSWLFGN